MLPSPLLPTPKCQPWEEKLSMEGERRGGQGRTHEHDEAVPVRRAALEPDHLLVWGAQRAPGAARPAQPSA